MSARAAPRLSSTNAAEFLSILSDAGSRSPRLAYISAKERSTGILASICHFAFRIWPRSPDKASINTENLEASGSLVAYAEVFNSLDSGLGSSSTFCYGTHTVVKSSSIESSEICHPFVAMNLIKVGFRLWGFGGAVSRYTVCRSPTIGRPITIQRTLSLFSWA